MPKAPYLRLWLGSLFLLALALGVSELGWRQAGYLPNVSDTKVFWSYHRGEVYTQGEKKRLVIVGASRAQVGLNPDVLASAFPEFEVVHLAIDGASPMAVLADLCLDEDFDGVILCSTAATMLLPNAAGEFPKSDEYIHFYHDTIDSGGGLEKKINGVVAAYLQSKAVVSSAVLSFPSQVATRLDPPKLGQHMRFNRYRPAFYYDRWTPEQLKNNRASRIKKHTAQLSHPLSAQQVEAYARTKLFALNSSLVERGGAVVFVRMPTSGEHWVIDEKISPKTEIWDNLNDWTDIPTVHFKDYPELAEYQCPDTSHLEAGDAYKFTQSLGVILRNLKNTSLRAQF